MPTRADFRRLFPNAADRPFAMAVAAHLRQQGLGERAILQALTAGADINERLGDGRLSHEDAWPVFERLGSQHGLSSLEIEAVGAIPTDLPVRAIAEPTAAEDARVIAEAEAAMKQDFDAYQRNVELRDRYADALDRSLGRPVERLDNAAAEERDALQLLNGRKLELEAMMGDYGSAYWKGEGAAQMQQDYLDIIQATSGDAGEQGDSP